MKVNINTSENKSDDESESKSVQSSTESDNESEVSLSKSASSDFTPDKNDKKEKRMMNMKLKEKRLKERQVAREAKKAQKKEAKREARIQKQKEIRLQKEKEKEEEKKLRRNKLRQLDNMRSNSNKFDDEKEKINEVKLESNPKIKIIKTETNHVVKDFVDYKNPILEGLDREMEDEDVVFVKQNENPRFIKEVPKFNKYGLHDEDDILSPKNSQNHEFNKNLNPKIEVKQKHNHDSNNIFKKHTNNHNSRNINDDDEDQMITPKHLKQKPISKNNPLNKPHSNPMNRMNHESQFKSTHKSIDTTSTPDEIKLYKRVSHIADESFKDRYCNLLKDLQTRIAWEKEKLNELFKTKFQNKIRINHDTV